MVFLECSPAVACVPVLTTLSGDCDGALAQVPVTEIDGIRYGLEGLVPKHGHLPLELRPE
jgi:hypothetical protein